MEFNIDPKDLNLQDAAGMQLADIIRKLADESGTADYEDLENLPKINGVTLVGDKSSDDLHIAVSDEQVTEAVDAWLDDNVDPETGYVLDNTLTLSNAAAPADKVGELKSALSGVVLEKQVTAANTNNRIDYSFIKGQSVEFKNNTSAACSVNLYKADGTPISINSDLHAGDTENIVVDNDGYTQIGGYCGGTGTINLTVIGYNDLINSNKDLINSYVYYTENIGLSDMQWTQGYITVNGSISSGAAYRYSELIPVQSGDTVLYNLYNANNVATTICAYNASGEYVKASSIYYDSSSGSGSIALFTGTYTVPNGIAYIRICHNVNYGSQSATVPKSYNVINELHSLVYNPWENKKWVAFGTSITDNYSQGAVINYGEHEGEVTGKYVSFLLNLSKLSPNKFVNRGIAGGAINGHILYYIRYYTSDEANADLITIEGAVNDFASSIPLGDVGDTVPYTNQYLPDSTEEGTFAGACYQAFTTAITNSPNATVVLLTETTGKNHVGYNDYSQTKTNTLGLTQWDYIDMTIKVAEFVGIPVIKCGQDSMINAQNPQYIADHIHHTYLGGYQYAKTIWAKLKNIQLKALSVPN